MRWLSCAPQAARVALVALLAALLAAGATTPLALADSDELDLEHYDRLPPDAAWRDSIRLNEVPPESDGAGVTVAVLDTGVTRHPDLGSRVSVRVDLSPDRDGYDRYAHGTHMVGLVAGDGSASGGRWAGAAPGASVLPVAPPPVHRTPGW